VRQWRRLLREFEPDLVILYGAKANLLGRLVRAGRRHPVIAAIRSTKTDDSGGTIGRMVERLTAGRVDLYVGNSRRALEQLDRVAPERRAYVPPGVDPGPASPAGRDIPVVLSVANLKTVKRHELLVAASAELLARGVPHRLRLVGDGPERDRLVRLAADLGVAGAVEFAGHVADPSPEYAAADVFALASSWEGTPMAVLEALAAGLPVVATAAGDIPEFVADGVSGRIVPDPTPVAMATAIEEALTHRADWGRAARATAAQLSIDRMAGEYERLFRQVAGQASDTRVLRIISRLNVGGPAIHVSLLASGLTRFGYQTRLVAGRLAPGEGDMSYVAVSGGVGVTSIPELGRSIRPWNDAIALVKLFRLMRTYRPQIVHTHASKAGALGRMAAAGYNWTTGGASRCAIVHTYHGHTFSGYFSPRAGAVLRTIERGLARVTDRIVVLSPSQQREIVEQFRIAPLDKTRIVPLGLPLESFFAVTGTDRLAARQRLGWDNRRVILTPGRLTAIKNHDWLLRAFRELAGRHSEALLAIAGDGDLREALERLARDLGIADRVRFLGWVRDLRDHYAAADVVVLTSRNEGTPVALIESIAAGCPVVATSVGGVPDVVSGDCGMLVPLDDMAALVAAVESTWGSRLSLTARVSMRRFAADRLLADVNALYQDVLRGRNGRATVLVTPRTE
jgi:glycosyltransferase involved in cell wall biosynthesis